MASGRQDSLMNGNYMLEEHQSILSELEKKYGEKNVQKARKLARSITRLKDNASDVYHLAKAFKTVEKAKISPKRVSMLAERLEKLQRQEWERDSGRKVLSAANIYMLTAKSLKATDLRPINKAFKRFRANEEIPAIKLKSLVDAHVKARTEIQRIRARTESTLAKMETKKAKDIEKVLTDGRNREKKIKVGLRKNEETLGRKPRWEQRR